MSCTANPSTCALARSGETSKQLEDDFWQWLFQLKVEPLNLGVSAMLTYTAAKTFMYQYMYQPSSWSNVSKILDASYKRNSTLIVQLLTDMPASVASEVSVLGEVGIKCSDKTSRTKTLEDWLPLVSQQEASSRLFGDTAVQTQTQCAQWEMPAVEIYQGDFKIKTKNPVLFGSNEYDPVTPLKSAKNMSSGFEGSYLLLNKNGHGVGSIVLLEDPAC